MAKGWRPNGTYVVTKRVIMNDEHRPTEMHITLPRIAFLGEDYQPPQPSAVRGPPKKYDIDIRAPVAVPMKPGSKRGW